jgi:hypothetical protein
MVSATSIVALLSAAPAALACLGYEGGLPKHTGLVPLKEPIYVKNGEVYDGQWQKFDRNPSSCNSQQEGGAYPEAKASSVDTDDLNRREGHSLRRRARWHTAQRYHRQDRR